MKGDRAKSWKESLYLVNFLVLLLIVTPVTSLTQSGFTFQKPDIVNVVTQAFIMDHYLDVYSPLECATKCITKRECFSFFYNERTLACQTHCRVFHQIDGSFVNSSGETYLQIAYEKCSRSDVTDVPQGCNRYGFQFNEGHEGCDLFLDDTRNNGADDVAAKLPMTTTIRPSTTTATSTTPTTTTTTKTTTTTTTPTPTLIPIYKTPHSQPENTCKWVGTAPFCKGSCDAGWRSKAKSKSGDGSKCWTGYKYKCCMAKLGCNGDFRLCDLPFDKVTFAGSHNSGSGYDGKLYYSSGIVALSCLYRNQELSFTDQLAIGVRYFDIDLCWKKNRLYNCHNNAYTNHLTHALDQISKFLSRTENHNEVVAMRFHDYNNVPKGKSGAILKELRTAFSGVGNRPGLNDQKRQFGRWPTLREAIQQNKRVFVFIHNHLCSSACRNENPWVLPEYYYTDTWMTRSLTFSCEGVIRESRQKCMRSHQMLQLSVFGSYGVCVDRMAKLCNIHLKASALACLEERKKRGRTVNFLLIDYVQHADGGEVTVRKVANEMNQLNIERFLN